MQAWFTLMAEMMRSTAEAQEVFKSLIESSTTSREMQEWLTGFTPPPANISRGETFEESLEEWWRIMGVVPRSRYLELLERYEILGERLKKAEATIENLRNMLDLKGQGEEETEKVLGLWDSILKETLKAQAEWMRSWGAAEKAADQENQVDDNEAESLT